MIAESDGPFARAKVFISHNHKDKQIAQEISVELLNHGHEVWLDKWEMVPGDSLISKINEGLSNSSYLVVLLSKDSVKSSWVTRELESALHRQLTTKDVTVIPCLLDDCDIPSFLIPIMYADFRPSLHNGISELLPGIKQVDLIKTGRLEKGDDAYISDFAFDWLLDKDRDIGMMRLEIIHHCVLDKQTIRTDFKFYVLGELQKIIKSIDVKYNSFQLITLLEAIIENLSANFSEGIKDFSLLLDGPEEYNNSIIFSSQKEGDNLKMSVSARRLGSNVDNPTRLEMGMRVIEYCEKIKQEIYEEIPPHIVKEYINTVK